MIIVCFASEPWHGLWQRHQHLMSRLGERGHKIIYVDPTNLMPALKESGLSLKRLERINDQVIVVRPLFLPFHYRLGMTERSDGWSTTRLISKALRLFHSTEPDVIWTYTPYYNFMLSKWESPVIIYDCVDACEGNFLKKRANERVRHWLTTREADLIRRADAVFAVSKGLLDRSIGLNENSLLLPNGTSLPSAGSSIPADLRDMKRPMVGYVGNLGDWVDYELLDEVASARPNYSLVLVGPVNSRNEHIKRLFKRANVHVLGKKDFSEVPGYIAGFDACLIPFTVQVLTQMANPVKLFEYASMGKPTVSTPLDGVLEFKDLVYASDGTRDGFIRQIDAALREEDEQMRQKRKAMARRHDWETITTEAESVIEDLVSERAR